MNRAALTAWGNRISPVFEAARMLCVIRVEERKVVGRRLAPIPTGQCPGQSIGRCTRLLESLQAMGVGTLICGAITESSAILIQSSRVELIAFVSGTIEEVAEAYAKKLPLSQMFGMPGCGLRQCRRGRRRGMNRKS